jgi:hypothetical protein
MRIEKYPEDGLGVSATGGDDATAVGNAVNVLQSPYASSTAPGDGYQIVFAYAYDSVMEVSPSGVMDITNAVL